MPLACRCSIHSLADGRAGLLVIAAGPSDAASDIPIEKLALAFNLLPAFPMDGGRIVRAIAWKITGKRSAATRFAAGLGRIFGYLFIGLGLFWAVSGSVFSGVWLALIGFLITGSAKAATAQTSITSKIEDVRVADVMDTQPVTMPGSIPIETGLDEYFLRSQWSWFCLLYTSDAADELLCVDLGGRRILQKKTKQTLITRRTPCV